LYSCLPQNHFLSTLDLILSPKQAAPNKLIASVSTRQPSQSSHSPLPLVSSCNSLEGGQSANVFVDYFNYNKLGYPRYRVQRLANTFFARPPSTCSPKMPLEATMIIIDNSEYMRNGDYQPTRFEAQSDAVNVVFQTKIDSNPENTVGIMTMAGKG